MKMNATRLSRPTQLAKQSKSPLSFTTNILIVGGAYAGLSALKNLVQFFGEKIENSKHGGTVEGNKISLTIIEPKGGLLNILGIPRAIVDPVFAKTQFVPFAQLRGLKFKSVLSSDEKVLESFNDSEPTNEPVVDINYVHGHVSQLGPNEAKYKLNNIPVECDIKFDYVIYGAGRNRHWPISPSAFDANLYVSEMVAVKDEIEKAEALSIIGGGAVGVELAGEIKSHFPHKTVNLIHPHGNLPKEPLSEKFKETVLESLKRAKVNVHLNTRISKELENNDLETTKGDVIHSSLNFWCNSYKNNTQILSENLKYFVSENNNIFVNEYSQVSHNGKTLTNFFAIGDLVEQPIIKSAGWAMYMGKHAANNVSEMILNGNVIEQFVDLNTMQRGMVLIAGNEDVISQSCGEIELNNEKFVENYQDYCFEVVREKLGL